jgi:hypothetical protein
MDVFSEEYHYEEEMAEPLSPTDSPIPSLVNVDAVVEQATAGEILLSPTAPRPTARREVSFVRSITEVFQHHPVSPKSEKDEGIDPSKLPIRERIRHFTWTWFTMTMATGGIANVL